LTARLTSQAGMYKFIYMSVIVIRWF